MRVDNADLPLTYRLCLWLEEQGCSDAQIAELLDVQVEAVNALVRIARIKARLYASPVGRSEEG